MLQICSFNCHSLKNSLTELHSICSKFDLIFLQETWLAKFELSLLNNIHADFLGQVISALNSTSALLTGRPYGGLAILWKKSLQPSINVTVHSERIMQIDIMTDVGQISLFNVYMPTDYRDMDSRDQFGMCIGELGCHLECVRANTNYFGVIGDFNANCYGSIFSQSY